MLASLGTPTKSVGSELSVVPITKSNFLDLGAQNHDLEPFGAGWPPLESKNHVRWRRPAGSKGLQIVILSQKNQKLGLVIGTTLNSLPIDLVGVPKGARTQLG